VNEISEADNSVDDSDKWVKRWAGSYTFISCSYWGPQYLKTLNRILGKGLDTTVFIHKKGTVTFLVKKEELDSLGNFLAKKVQENKGWAVELLNKLKENTDVIMAMMDKLSCRIMDLREYNRFIDVFEKHLAYHVFMKKTVDYLSDELLGKMLPLFKDARVYSEAVYSRTEKFFRDLAKVIGEKENVSSEYLTCLSQEELERYLSEQALPQENILKERYESSVLLCEGGKMHIFTGEGAVHLEKEIIGSKHKRKMVQGNSVCPGLVTGKCRIIHDPLAEVEFEQGDILVTGMTRPEFIRFYDKAGAIVTDAGGKLCHAALIAMEMNKPCVVGTGNATQHFNDGDMIHVDATEGVVRKLW